MKERLEPIRSEIFSYEVKSEIERVGKMVGKRIGGGRVQMNIMSWSEIAKIIVSVPEAEKGFDAQSKTNWTVSEFALSRVFQENGWPIFRRAIVIAGVVRWSVQPKSLFIPYAPGKIDIEAGMKIEADEGHKELVIYGKLGKPDESFLKEVNSRIGFATEYGNGPDSLEVVIPVYTPGIWEKIEDLEFKRQTGMVVVTPYLTLWCEEMSINRLGEMPTSVTSKMTEAIKIAKHLCRIE